MTNYKVVAQYYDLGDDEQKKAHTGRITCRHLHKAGAVGTLIGHAETGDDIETIVKKVRELIALQEQQPDALPFNVILLGETEEEFSKLSLGEITQLIKKRCDDVFKDIPEDFIKQSLLVYQPKWGLNDAEVELPSSPKLITRVTMKIRDFLVDRLGPAAGVKVTIMYGEVQSAERAVAILQDENLQGIVLGSACRSVEKLMEVVKALQYAFNKRKIILVCNFKAYDLEDNYQDYLKALDLFPDNFTVYFAPPATGIKELSQLIKQQ